MINYGKSLVAGIVLAFGANVFAGPVHLNFSTETRHGTVEKDETLAAKGTGTHLGAEDLASTNQTYRVGGLYQVMPDLPVAAGLSLGFDKSTPISNPLTASNNTNNFGWEASIDVKAWVPGEVLGVNWLSPSVGISYVPYSSYTHTYVAADDKTDTYEGSQNGLRLNAGTNLTLTENVSFDLGYTLNFRTNDMEVKYADDANETLTEWKDKRSNFSHGFVFGLTANVM